MGNSGARLKYLDIAKGIGIFVSGMGTCKRAVFRIYISISYAVVLFDFGLFV